jgi:non-specific protein-tyrosine kinase
MKLRIALDKAKTSRKGRASPDLGQKPMIKEKKPGGEWFPPVYSQSAHVEINTGTLLENRCVCIEPDAAEIDAYKVLRTKIQHLTQQKGWNTLMITSPRPGEGKTLTAVNLALTFSKAYQQTVLLVDCDLRNQSVHNVLGLQSDSGLMDYLVDKKPLSDFIIWPGVDKLTVISGGRTIQSSTELLGSPRMKALVEEMKFRYRDRYVLFDVPPILLGADALALAPYIDCIIMVVQEGRTSTRDIKKAVEMIPSEKFLGFVLNRQTSFIKDGYYKYYRG